MGVFSAIILSEASLVRAGEAQLPESRAVGAQLVGDQQLRCEALFLEYFAHQPECRLRIAPTLNEHVEDLAFMVDGAPQIHPFPGDPNDHLVEVPSRARAGAALSQLARDQRAEFQHPAPHRFIGDVEPTLGEQFLYVSVAQGEAEIKPDCVLNDLGRKAMSAVGERSHLDILSGTPLSRLRFRDNARRARLLSNGQCGQSAGEDSKTFDTSGHYYLLIVTPRRCSSVRTSARAGVCVILSSVSAGKSSSGDISTTNVPFKDIFVKSLRSRNGSTDCIGS